MALFVDALPASGGWKRVLGGPTVVFPLRASVVEVICGERSMVLGRTSWGLAPQGATLHLRAQTPGGRVLLGTATAPLVARVVALYRELRLDGPRLARWLGELQELPRTVWVDEIVQRYLFERQVCGGHDNDATRFLEAEIIKEAYYLLRDREEGTDRASFVVAHPPTLERALTHIETHLFDAPDVRSLARAVGASESTLLRNFKRGMGCTPSAYWRMRRLDEALTLLESGRYGVAEVALMVGYDNPSAFTQAFQARFSRLPSDLVP